MYTSRHTQWYYFRVCNAIPGVTYHFKITNLLKKSSLYNSGMRPLLYSEKDACARNVGWVRTGHHILYRKNDSNLQSALLSKDRTYYLLEWQMEFPHTEDTCYLAHCYPYTYTDLKDDLEILLSDQERAKVMKREVMCETRAGNSCFLITVTNFAEDKMDPEKKKKKKGIVVTARVHPGETNSSWMMKGLLEFVTGKNQCAKELRKRFILKIVPMLNPDGVIVGNYRCSLAGRDLNRNYRNPRQETFPTVYHTKMMMEEFSKSNDIILYCDLHGHSRKQNVFMYGCNAKGGQALEERIAERSSETFLKERLFPWLMAQKAPDKFHFHGCKFHIRKCKESTGRVVMFRQLKISNSFTMEATFCGTNICRGEKRHFNVNDYENMGKVFCEVALEFDNIQQNKQRQTELVLDMTKAVAQQVLESRGLLPPGFPDFTTEKGREKLKETVNDPSLTTTEQFNKAFTQYITRERAHLALGLIEASKKLSKKSIDPDSVVKLLDIMSGKALDICCDLLKNLDLETEADDESGSSDSDSESDPEMIYNDPPKLRKKKKKNKKNKEQKSYTDKGGRKKSRDDNADNGLPSLEGENYNNRKHYYVNSSDNRMKQMGKSYPTFVSKYAGRSNGGIPCFSQERVLERAAKRMEEMQKRMIEEQQKKDSLYYFGDVGDVRDGISVPKSAAYDANRVQPLLNMQIKTSYIHAGSPTASPKYATDTSDEESDFEPNYTNPSLAAMNTPYGTYQTMAFSRAAPVGPVSGMYTNCFSNKLNRLPPLMASYSAKLVHSSSASAEHSMSSLHTTSELAPTTSAFRIPNNQLFGNSNTRNELMQLMGSASVKSISASASPVKNIELNFNKHISDIPENRHDSVKTPLHVRSQNPSQQGTNRTSTSPLYRLSRIAGERQATCE